MPTYEYVCTECGTPLEVVQSIHEPSLTECPECRGKLRKVFGNVGVVFKGSGFYRTDSRGKTSATATGGKSEKPAASTTSKPAASSSESSSTPAAPAAPSTSTASKASA